MNQAQHIIPWLRQLAELEGAQRQLKNDSDTNASLAAKIESLRAVLPTSILSHHDALRTRGKISVAPVTRGVCGSCHLTIPRGHLGQLRRVADDLSVCDHCGVFIYLAEEDLPSLADLPKAVAGGSKKLVRAKRVTRCAHPNEGKPLPAR